MVMGTKRNVVAGAVVLISLTGCGGGADSTSDASLPEASSAPTSRHSAATSTTTAARAPETTAIVDAAGQGSVDVAPSDAVADLDSLDDSPQTPSADGVAVAALADGTHFGFVRALDTETSSIVFDVAQLMSGPSALEAAFDDGAITADGSGLVGGLYVRNRDPLERLLLVSRSAPVRLLTAPDQPGVGSSSLQRFGALMAIAGASEAPVGVAVVIVVESGSVVAIEQQYLPTGYVSSQ